MKTCFCLLALVPMGANAFTTPKPTSSLISVSTKQKAFLRASSEPSSDGDFSSVGTLENHPPKEGNSLMNIKKNNYLAAKAALVTATVWTATSEIATAAGPDWGIFEGRTGSLLHPIAMASMFLFSAYTAFLGFQWRRQRTLGDEISALKKTLPDMGGASSVAEAVAAAQEAGDSAKVSALQAAKGTESEIAALQQERKDLAAAGPRDRHFAQGALLAFIGTAFAIEGPLNTYARAGKLFPGPHLYVGASLVVIWSLAVATIPSMQKGNDTARTIHIGANCLGLAFFAWQVQSGIPILLKVIEKTSWP